MSMICAWCKRVIEPSNEEKHSHGICVPCSKEFLNEAENVADRLQNAELKLGVKPDPKPKRFSSRVATLLAEPKREIGGK